MKDKIVLVTDPAKNSGNVVDLQRIWAPRVPAKVVKVHLFSIRGHYEVVTSSGKQFRTGRVYKTKDVIQTAPVAL